MSISYRDKVLADGPVAFWPMTEDGTTITDVVGGVKAVIAWGQQGRPLRPSPLPYYPGTVDFPGNNHYYEVAPADAAPIAWAGGDYTAEVWLHSDSNGADAVISSRLSTSDTSTQGFSLFSGANGFGVFLSDFGTSATRQVHPEYVIPINEWIHVALTYKVNAENTGGTRRLYINGAQVSVATKSHTIPTTVSPLLIGALGANTTYCWDGGMNSLALYKKELTAAQVAAHYAARANYPYGNAKAYVDGAWQVKPFKRWDGTQWKVAPLKRWNGTSWIYT